MPFLGNLLGGIGLKIMGGLAIVGAVLAILAGARNAGRNAERVESLTKTLEIKNAQAKAAAAAPRNRDTLIDELRDGKF